MSTNQDQNLFQSSRKVPFFLQVRDQDKALSYGKPLEIDQRIAEGRTDLTALDTVKIRAGIKTRAYKKAKRAMLDVEEQVEFFNKKLKFSKGIPGGHEVK